MFLLSGRKVTASSRGRVKGNSDFNMDLTLGQFQSQNSDRPIRALILVRINAGFACGYEAALFHHTARGGIIYEVAADERFYVRRLSDMV